MYKKKKIHIHFMGIGGIGMSGIAKVLKGQGYNVSGCDLDHQQKSIRQLKEMGCVISPQHDSELCKDESIDVLVYSSAISQNHPEITYARKRGIPVIPRALMLAELMRTKFSIAIAGSHGKTTTTSMISHVLMHAKLNPTIIIGGHLKNISTNAQLGTGDFLVAEADESDRSLLKLHATLGLITNIDLEHLDTYKDLDDIKSTFKQFLNNLPFYGKAILCIDDENVRSLLPLPHLKTITYGFNKAADIYGKNITLERLTSSCTVYEKDKKLGTLTIKMAGEHNLQNALGAIALARDLDIPFKVIAEALANLEGIDRRFSYHGTFKGAEIFDDYAHHPKEIAQILKVARKRTKGKLHVLFQPHRYTRTLHLWNEFIQTFLSSDVDHLVLTDIFPASEAPIKDVSSEKLVEALKKENPQFSTSFIPLDDQFNSLVNYLKTFVNKDDLVLLLGAGKIYQIPYILK